MQEKNMQSIYTVTQPILSDTLLGSNPRKKFYLPQDVLEWGGRICYRSTPKFRSNPDFIQKIIDVEHLDVLEHGYAGFLFDINEEYDTQSYYYLYHQMSRKYPFLRVDLSPSSKQIGIYGNFRAWRELYVNDFDQIWGVINRLDMQELILTLSNLAPQVFPVPSWLISQDSSNALGGKIRSNYAHAQAMQHGYNTNVTSTGANVILLAKTPKTEFTNRYHATFQLSGVSRALTHQLVRHRLMSFCLSGDTFVNAFGSNKKWTMSTLYSWSNDARYKGKLKLITLRGMDNDKKIIPVKIKSVIKSGAKDVYEVTVKSGKKIKSTLQHLYSTPSGWRQLEDLSIGDLVWTNGIEAYKDIDFVREHYLIQNKERKVLAQEVGCSDATLGKWIARNGLQKSKSMYPNRKAGHGTISMHTKEEKRNISLRMIGENNHQWKGDNVGDSGGRLRANKMYEANSCSICDSIIRVQRHHVDKNPINNSPENIEILCELCHKARHNNATKIVLPDEIISIKYIGIEETYDLEIDHECHNFIADGFVVHNSQESQRYVDGTNFQYVMPHFDSDSQHIVKSTISYINESYRSLRSNKVLKEDARCLLPNAAMTQIIVSGEETGWNHFIKLRTASDAQSEIREVACIIEKILSGEKNA